MIQKGLELDVATDPPPSPEARALGAIGYELDVIGDTLSTLSAGVSGLQQLGEEDAVTLRQLARGQSDMNAKLDRILALLIDPAEGLLPRLERLETWRGEHARAHAAE